MKTLIVASLALMCVAVSLPAYANTNGVYVRVTDEFYGYSRTRTSPEHGPQVTTSHKVAYACNGSGSFIELPQGAGLKYCSRSAEVKFVWKREDVGSFAGPSLGLDAQYLESYRVVDDGNASHCKTGEAVIWDVGAQGHGNVYSSMRDYCQYCAYTGGDCE